VNDIVKEVHSRKEELDCQRKEFDLEREELGHGMR